LMFAAQSVTESEQDHVRQVAQSFRETQAAEQAWCDAWNAWMREPGTISARVPIALEAYEAQFKRFVSEHYKLFRSLR
jgi:Mg2+ and Co2+ transporter CorA